MCTHWYIYGLLFLEKIYIPIKRINRYKINKLEYYRDELNEYSPLINAKILDKDIYDQDVIVAMLLYIDEKNLDKNSTELLKHEKEFIDKEKFIFHDIRNRQNTLLYENTTLKEYIEDLIEDDMRDLKLVESECYSKHDQKTDILTVLFFFINIFCLCKIIQYPNDVLNNIFIFEIIINLTWMIIYSINTFLNLTFKMNLTEKGIIYLSKLNGSKKFLKNYSIINKRTVKEEKLWGSYIRNAIFFDLKGKLDVDAKKYYKQILDKYKYKEFWKLKLKKIKYIITTNIVLIPWFILLFVQNTNTDKMLFNFILSNFIINPFILNFFINKEIFFLDNK